MLNRNKIVSFTLIFFFINGLFVTAFNPVLASEIAENSWNTRASMHQARTELGVIAVDGKIYAIGGHTDSKFVCTNEQYNPVDDTWVTLNSMPTPRANFAIAAYDSKIYCIGGYSDNYYDTNPKTVFSINEVYDTSTDSWSTKASLPVAMEKLVVHVIDDKFFVIDTSKSNLFLYDPVQDSWIKKTVIPSPEDSTNSATDSFYGFSVAVNDKIIVYFTYVYATWTFRNKVMIYDTKTNVWSEGRVPSCIPDDVSNPFAPFTNIEGLSVVTSGINAPQKAYVFSAKYETLVYDPADDTWSTTKAIPTIRRCFDIAIVNDLVYVIGGNTGEYFARICSINEQYVPIGYSSTPIGSKPSDSLITSEPEPSTSLQTCLLVVILAITTLIIAMGMFFYFKKRKSGVTGDVSIFNLSKPLI
jgi:N-acetylneuraminic acid mutarotase